MTEEVVLWSTDTAAEDLWSDDPAEVAENYFNNDNLEATEVTLYGYTRVVLSPASITQVAMEAINTYIDERTGTQVELPPDIYNAMCVLCASIAARHIVYNVNKNYTKVIRRDELDLDTEETPLGRIEPIEPSQG
jgi:hypothetical protein